MSAIRDHILLETAVQQALLSAEQLNKMRKRAQTEQINLLLLACFELRITPSVLYRHYADLKGYRFVEGALQPDLQGLRKLGLERALQYHILPILCADQQNSLLILCANPEERSVRQMAARMSNEPLLALAEPENILQTLHKYAPVVRPYEMEDLQAPLFDPVKTVADLMNHAYLARASDLHIEPEADGVGVRFRIDGRLQSDGRLFNHDQGAALVSRVKVMAELDIAENRIPQDGGMSHQTPVDVAIDMRVATLPTQYGERVTIRLLGGDKQLLDLAKIGMSPEHLAAFRNTIAEPHGIVLITGPTGSGKSTTLYAALNERVSPELNILTAEDPVEMRLPGVSQLQVNSKTGFADALRSFLRHDPDVIMVGEIRDRETAEIAMKASLTGHLVFSTLHTNSAFETIPRLVDIGIEPYLAASTLRCVIAQRLVRRLCEHCRQPLSLSKAQAEQLACAETEVMYQASGCARCQDRGYRGRIALFEILWLDEEMAEAVANRKSIGELKQSAGRFTSLAEDGRDKLWQGLTSLAELQRLGLWGHLE